jgi:hypothetical protein
MPLYLYRFGFESPRQFRHNEAHGWDDEDSQGVFIEANDEASALRWGQEISEQFIKLLFKDNGVSWRELGYAHWIEPPDKSWAGQQQVVVGMLPDFASWLRPYAGEA